MQIMMLDSAKSMPALSEYAFTMCINLNYEYGPACLRIPMGVSSLIVQSISVLKRFLEMEKDS